MATRRVTEWTTNADDLLPYYGDLIEFNRNAYSHWGVYVGDGKVLHFHPTDPTRRVGVQYLEVFVPGSVNKDDISKVAGISEIRVNNKPDFEKPLRSTEEMQKLEEALLNQIECDYCLHYFNCEHFATFFRFEDSQSSQIDTFESLMVAAITSLHLPLHELRRDENFSTLAYKQWCENANASVEKRKPKHVLHEAVSRWLEKGKAVLESVLEPEQSDN